MGGEVLSSLLQSPEDFYIKCIVYEEEKKLPSFVKKLFKKHSDRIYRFRGNIARYEDCIKLLEDADYLLHCAALIPPKSDHNPKSTYLSNYVGTKNLADAVIEGGNSYL